MCSHIWLFARLQAVPCALFCYLRLLELKTRVYIFETFLFFAFSSQNGADVLSICQFAEVWIESLFFFFFISY